MCDGVTSLKSVNVQVERKTFEKVRFSKDGYIVEAAGGV